MLAYLADSPLGFWIIAFLIILLDSILLLDPHELTFTFEERLDVRLRIAPNPYLLRHREPVLTLFAYPLTAFFISSLDMPAQGRRTTKQVLLSLKRLTFKSKQLVSVALSSLILVCVAGPIISFQYGIERALFAVIPALYASALLGFAMLYASRQALTLNKSDLIHIAGELLICPILIVNVFKRIAVRQRRTSTTDVVQHFSKDRDRVSRMLSEHVGAVAK